jgi:hypothetical protein
MSSGHLAAFAEHRPNVGFGNSRATGEGAFTRCLFNRPHDKPRAHASQRHHGTSVDHELTVKAKPRKRLTDDELRKRKALPDRGWGSGLSFCMTTNIQ